MMLSFVLNSSLLLLLSVVQPTVAFCPSAVVVPSRQRNQQRQRQHQLSSQQEAWNGDVVTNADGKIRGCSLAPAKDPSLQDPNELVTEWTITIDGVEADLGRFSDAIYRKVMSDAKQQRFQGFRPGTIPPHLEPTYRAYAMDECARETVLEAMQQNNVRPFDSCRAEMVLENFEIPPAAGKKKKRSKKKKKGAVVEPEVAQAPEEPPSWRSFPTMKEAISAGWKPGQSFSFVATNVRGQKLKDPAGESNTLNFAS